MIVFWKDFTATEIGAATRQVQCENCSTEYVYSFSREVTAHAVSWFYLTNEWSEAKARERAKTKLARRLEKDVEAVPCPSCGHYQANMIGPARRTGYRWMSSLLFWAICTAPVTLMLALLTSNLFRDRNDKMIVSVSMILWIFGGFLLVCLALIVLVRPLLRRCYDPNREPIEHRLALGKSMSSPAVDTTNRILENST